jgi:hypothetical protein
MEAQVAKCIIIPHDMNNLLARTELSSLTDYQTAVGGYIESITMRDPGVALFCDEDGKEKQLPINRRATAFWWLFEPAIRGHDLIVGDAILVGLPDLLGDTGDIPEELAVFMIDGERYKVEVLLGDGVWIESHTRFDNYFYAAMFAMRIIERTGYRANVRIVLA